MGNDIIFDVPIGLLAGVVMLAALGVGLTFWFLAAHNTLSRLRQYCRESWSMVEIDLQHRYELIPRFCQIMRGHVEVEPEMLDGMVQACQRAAVTLGTPRSRGRTENELAGALRRVLAAAMNSPELADSEGFQNLRGELATVEDRIGTGKLDYNAAARRANSNLRAFPSNLMGLILGMRNIELFDIQDVGVAPIPEDAAQGQ